MVGTLTWVLVGVVAFTVAAMAVDARGLLPESVRVAGPILTLHTGRGRAFLDRLASPRRFWRAWGNLGVGAALVAMVGSALAVFTSALQAIRQPERTPVQNPQNALVIPGVNDFLPPAAAPEIVFGLLVGLVVHEGGHGLLCRVEDIDIDSMGLALFSFIPIGAFVEPDEDSRNAASRGSQTRMFAAGVTNNFFVTFLAFLLLFGPVSGSIAVAAGVPVGGVLEGSTAASGGLDYGDVVTSVEGQPVANESAFEDALARADSRQVRIGLKDGRTTTVNRTLLITRWIPEVLESVNVSRGNSTAVERVNGTAVYDERGFERAMANRTVARVETSRGNATFPVGAYVTRVQEGEPFARAGAPTNGSRVIVTRVDGRRTPNVTALTAVLGDAEPGETVPVVAYVDGDRETYRVTLDEDENGDGGYLGVRIQRGYSGLVVDGVGIDPYPAGQFLAFLGGESGPLGGLFSGDFLRLVFVALILPFASVIDPTISYNFAGFLPQVVDFYTVIGPLAVFGNGVFPAANLLFWTGWVNLNLGLFNCIPMVPLDGGHILRSSAESFVSRLPVSNARPLTSALTTTVSLVMLAGLGLMLFGPRLF
ncbi:MAG: site-2 protease family protein [Haloarculaceae archaeon]